MKAVILAAGRGTRMKQLTRDAPKPMLPVRGKPILEWILEGLLDAGIREFFIVTKYRAEVVREHFGDGGRWDARIAYGTQGDLPGTAKAVEPAREFVGTEPFLLSYGDILARPAPYASMVERFSQGRFGGLITVTRGEEIAKGGLVLFNDNFLMSDLLEKPSPEEVAALQRQGRLRKEGPFWYNAGIYIFDPALFDYIADVRPSPRGEYELTDAIRAMAAGGLLIAGLEIPGRWADVRDPEVLARLEQDEI